MDETKAFVILIAIFVIVGGAWAVIDQNADRKVQIECIKAGGDWEDQGGPGTHMGCDMGGK